MTVYYLLGSISTLQSTPPKQSRWLVSSAQGGAKLQQFKHPNNKLASVQDTIDMLITLKHLLSLNKDYKKYESSVLPMMET